MRPRRHGKSKKGTATEFICRSHQLRHAKGQSVAAVLRFVRLRADHGLRRLGLARTAYARAQCTTIQLKLLRIDARLRITRAQGLAVVLRAQSPFGGLRTDPRQSADLPALGRRPDNDTVAHFPCPVSTLAEGELRQSASRCPKTPPKQSGNRPSGSVCHRIVPMTTAPSPHKPYTTSIQAHPYNG